MRFNWDSKFIASVLLIALQTGCGASFHQKVSEQDRQAALEKSGYSKTEQPQYTQLEKLQKQLGASETLSQSLAIMRNSEVPLDNDSNALLKKILEKIPSFAASDRAEILLTYNRAISSQSTAELSTVASALYAALEQPVASAPALSKTLRENLQTLASINTTAPLNYAKVFSRLASNATALEQLSSVVQAATSSTTLATDVTDATNALAAFENLSTSEVETVLQNTSTKTTAIAGVGIAGSTTAYATDSVLSQVEKMAGASLSWNAITGATSYKVVVTNSTTNQTVCTATATQALVGFGALGCNGTFADAQNYSAVVRAYDTNELRSNSFSQAALLFSADLTPPTLALGAPANANLQSGGSTTIPVVATGVTGFTLANASLLTTGGNCTATLQMLSADLYRVNVAACTPGTFTVRLANDAVFDAAGNGNAISNVATVVVKYPPTFTGSIAAQTTPEDTAATSISFAIADTDSTITCAGSVAAISSNTTLVPNSGIQISGSGTTCSMDISPAANQNGSATITLTVTDETGLAATQQFALSVTPVNDAPTNIALNNTSTAENAGPNAVVGTFSSTDIDSSSFSYTLLSTGCGGGSYPDSTSFNVSGSSLRATGSLNYESQNSYSICVRTTDADTPNLSYEKVFAVSVTNVNENPTDIALSNSSIDENAVANATVGTLSSTDPDAGSTFTYSLQTNGCAGGPYNDNATFDIDTTSLVAKNSLNYEVKNSYSICVRTTDSGSAYFEKSFTISVTNVNENPTDIALSNSSIAENAGVNATVGTLSSTDPDTGNTFTYSLQTSGCGGTYADSALFNISVAALRANASFNYEVKNSYSICIRTTDSGTPNLYYEKLFLIAVTNVNDAPTIASISTQGANQTTASQPIAVTVSDEDGPAQTCNSTYLSYTSSDTNLVAATGAVAWSGAWPNCSAVVTPTASQGTTTLAFAANDGSLTGAATSFSFVVNSSPTIGAIGNTTINEDNTTTVTFAITDSDGPSQTCNSTYLRYTSSNTALVPSTGAVTWSGTWPSCQADIAPLANQNGTSTIGIAGSDGTGWGVAQTFTLTVNSVNDTPNAVATGATSLNLTEDDTATTFALGSYTDVDVATNSETLSYEVATAPTKGTLGTWPAVPTSSTVNLTYTPSANQHGTDTLVYRVCDNNASKACASDVTVTFTIAAVNDTPTLVTGGDASKTTNEDTAASIAMHTATDPDTTTNGQTLTYLISTSPTHGSLGSAPASAIAGGNITYTPDSNYNGADSFTYTICDNNTPTATCTASTTVSISVTAQNDSPTNIALSSTSIAENSGANATVGTLSTTDNDVGDTFTYTLVANCSGNNADNASFSIVSSDLKANANLDYETKTSYTICVRSTDNSSAYFEKSFTISVTNLNESPTISDVGNQTTRENETISSVAVTIGDVDSTLTCAGSLSATASTNTTLIPTANITFSGTAPNCTMNIALAVNQIGGPATVTIQVTDGALSATDTFTLTVTRAWYQEAYIKPSAGVDGVKLGKSVAISGDTIAAVASDDKSLVTTITNGTAPGSSNPSGATFVGAAYVYRRSGTTWAQEAYIKASNAEAGDEFGNNQQLALNGDTLAVGAAFERSNQSTITNGTTPASSDNSASEAGAVYVYRRNGSNEWSQEAYIKPSNNVTTGRGIQFGRYASISLSGDTLVVGALAEDSNQSTITNGTGSSSNTSFGDSGAVYVYRRSGTTWAQEAYIKASNANASDQFGQAATISGDTMAVGAPKEDSNQSTISSGTSASSDNSLTESGSVYIFRRNQSNQWASEAYIKAANVHAGDMFGEKVSLSGDTLAVSALGEDSNQTTITNGSAASADVSGSSNGAVYVYRRSGTAWQQEAYIKAGNGKASDQFGWSISLAGDTLAVATRYEGSAQTLITNGTVAAANTGLANSGAAYLYRRTGATWVQEAYIKASNAGADAFGAAVALSGDTVAVGSILEASNQTTITNGTGASADNSAANTGAVYVYRNTARMFDPHVYVSARTTTSITFSWAANLGSTKQIKVAPAVNSTSTPTINCTDSGALTLNAGDTSYTYSGLIPGSKYGFRFCAWDGTNASEGSTIWDSTSAPSGWYQEAYIKPANASTSNPFFGMVTALHGDTLAVGQLHEQSNQTNITNGTSASSDTSLTGAGAVFVYRRNNGAWAQEAYIKSPHLEADASNGWSDNFGASVAISGNTMAVGAPFEDANQNTITNGTTANSDNSLHNSGAVFVYTRSGTTWAQEAYIKASNASAEDSFGNSIIGPSGIYVGTSLALSGNTIAVAKQGDDSAQTTITNGTTSSSNTSATDSGAVFVYTRSGTTWSQEAYIKASNAEANDAFGFAVALNGDTLAVSALWEDSNDATITNGATSSADNSASDAGAVYVYRRTGTTWSQEAFIKPANTNASDYFGYSVSLSGNTLAVGATKEASNQNTITNGTTASADNSATDSGAVYVFRREVTTWSQEAYIKSANSAAGDWAGLGISLKGDTLAVAARYEDSSQTTITNGTDVAANSGATESGAVYVYTRSGATWSQEAYIKATNTEAGDRFGSSIKLSGDTLVVGATDDDSNQATITNGTTASSDNSALNAGSVFVYRNLGRKFDPDVCISARTTTSITLAWPANLGSTSQVKVEKSTSTNAPTDSCAGATAITLDAGTTSYTYSGLTSGQKYGFRLCAIDANGVLFGTATIWADTL